MRIVTADEIVHEIDALALERAVVAVDADGTLWSGDVGEEQFLEFLAYNRVAPEAAHALGEELLRANFPPCASSEAALRFLYDRFREGTFAEDRMYEVMAWCFAGWTLDDAFAFARDVLRRGRIVDRVQREVVDVLARVARFPVYVVSASPALIVRAALAEIGLQVERVIGVDVRVRDDVIEADIARPIPYREGKVVRLREQIGMRPVALAMGDSAFDLALLCEAKVAVAMRPKAALRTLASTLSRLCELAPELAPT